MADEGRRRMMMMMMKGRRRRRRRLQNSSDFARQSSAWRCCVDQAPCRHRSAFQIRTEKRAEWLRRSRRPRTRLLQQIHVGIRTPVAAQPAWALVHLRRKPADFLKTTTGTARHARCRRTFHRR